MLRLYAIDSGGNDVSTEITVSVAGDLKLGNFTLSFTDLSIPVSGIPVAFVRTYDTLTSSEDGQLGSGWRMEFRDTNLRTSVQRTGMEEYGVFNGLKAGDRVYLTPPGGQRVSFRFAPVSEYTFFGQEWYPQFVPEVGEYGQLLGPGGYDLRLRPSPGGFEVWGEIGLKYNPEDPLVGGYYTYISKEGIEYQIDAKAGDLRHGERSQREPVELPTIWESKQPR